MGVPGCASGLRLSMHEMGKNGSGEGPEDDPGYEKIRADSDLSVAGLRGNRSIWIRIAKARRGGVGRGAEARHGHEQRPIRASQTQNAVLVLSI